MSLVKAPKPLHKYDRLHVEGHCIGTSISSKAMTASVEMAVSTFIRLDYAEVTGDMIILTDKGKAFVELLDEKGFVCDFINGHILTEGYVSVFKTGSSEAKY